MFTSTIINQLYASQNATGNIALSGIGLYVLMGAINVALKGRSYDQLSQFLGENFEDFFDNNTDKYSNTSRKWGILRFFSIISSNVHTALFCSCNINYHYKKNSDKISDLNQIVVNFLKPGKLSRVVNEWLSRKIYGSPKIVFDESKLNENTMIFIYTMVFRPDWENNFNVSLTKRETFYDDKGKLLEVSMMNQESYNFIYESPDNNFRILFKPFARMHFYSAIILPSDGNTVQDVLRDLKVFVIIYLA
ncbi:Leukocyte elastase inhibitor [Thelohanellus kitauei]|uniref:Leukocyte elastase inhibitor n=1 Tax=Thelohanellus kitauei TaxID=669202 RepID=A0A0C2J4I7_THEKT|nr:Leukocyte elastase inhibitor [Thelohanellus kitauei]